MNTKSIFIITFCCLVFNCHTNKKEKGTPKASQKPNIVFILVDDLGYADVGFNGSKYYETPTIDSLAQNGLIFENSYMYPTCSPSRTALFTGKQSFRTGVYCVPVLERGNSDTSIFSRWTVGREHPIYAEYLEKVGYQSIHLGKWHIVGPYPQKELNMTWPIQEHLTQPDAGDYSWVENHKSPEVKQYYPEGRGFKKNVGGTYRGDPALEAGGYKSVNGGYIAPFKNPFITQKEDDEWLTDRLTNDAIAFIDEHKDQPFLINLHYYTVHKPIRSRTNALYSKYINKPGDTILGQGVGTEKKRKEMAGYATMIESLDDNLKKIADYLEKNNLSKNTLIVFSSDNGYNVGQSSNYLMRGAKRQIYEGGVRVPTFAYWPGKVTPRRTEVPISVLDYFPTFLDLAGVTYKKSVDGESIVPLFSVDIPKSYENKSVLWHIASATARQNTCSAIRKGDYKLIQYLDDGKLELYNLKEDLKESNNIIKSNPQKAQELTKELETWRKNNKVPLPPSSPLTY